jgi:hypothetical protein
VKYLAKSEHNTKLARKERGSKHHSKSHAVKEEQLMKLEKHNRNMLDKIMKKLNMSKK